MKKKLLAHILTLIICFMGISAQAAEDTVSISFRIGDSTLMINGNPVEVEKPFIQGEGTTLVPLRVITEAFGADVAWEPVEQKITLTYPDVTLILQIGNKYADVNSHTEELPEAPVLTEKGITMVPLRFISDTYGADVSWDDGLITVTKEPAGEFGSMVEGMADSDKIGDSYYGWTMDNPKSMSLYDRDFDGSYVSFTNDNYDYIDIYVTHIDDTTSSFDDYFTTAKSQIPGVLTRQDKLSDEKGNKYFIIQSKFENDYYYTKCYYSTDKVYEVISAFTAEDNTFRDEMLAIIESFCAESLSDDVYDLSDVSEDGTRTFTNEKYKVSINLPASFVDLSSGENEFLFASPDDASDNVAFNIFSKTDDASAISFAEHDRKNNRMYTNPEYVLISDIITEEINGVTVYKYIANVSESSGKKYVIIDNFFENGDYIYNCSITAKTQEEAENIFSTFKTEALNTEEIGTLLRNIGSNEENITIKTTDWSLVAPGNWTQVSPATAQGVMLTNEQSVIMLVRAPMTGVQSLEAGAKEVVEQQTISNGATVHSALKRVTIEGKTFYTATLKTAENDTVAYTTLYISESNKTVNAFILGDSELCYNSGSAKDLERIISSFQTLK